MRRNKSGRLNGQAIYGIEYEIELLGDIHVYKYKYKSDRMNCQAIYDMLGAGSSKPTDTAEERAKNIFNRFLTKCIYLYISLSSFNLVC